MAKFGDMFPSRWLRAADLSDGDLVVTVKDVVMERIGQGADQSDKYVLHFVEEKKGLVLNKTNAQVLCKLFGDETEDWIGKKISLFPCDVQFKQEMVEAIRIRPRAPSVRNRDKPVAPAKSEAEEDIPF